MKVYQVDKNAEVAGDTIYALVDGMGAFQYTANKILKENGISSVERGKWYNMQNFLNAFKIIAEKIGDNTLKQIGKKIADNATLPPGVDSYETFFPIIDDAYHMNARGAEVGHYKYKEISSNEIEIQVSSPYPCAYDIGVLAGFLKKLQKPDQFHANVEHIEGACRMKGDNYCTYKLTW